MESVFRSSFRVTLNLTSEAVRGGRVLLLAMAFVEAQTPSAAPMRPESCIAISSRPAFPTIRTRSLSFRSAKRDNGDCGASEPFSLAVENHACLEGPLLAIGS